MKHIRRLFAAALGICMITLNACNKVTDAIKVNVPLQMAEVDFTIPQTTTGEHDLALVSVYANIDSTIRAYNQSVNAGNIRSVKIKSCTVSILDDTFHPDDNFTAFTRFNADLSSNVKADWTTVAILDGTFTDPYEVNLPVNNDLDLKDYFKGATFTFRMQGKLKRALLNDVHCRATISFDIEAGL